MASRVRVKNDTKMVSAEIQRSSQRALEGAGRIVEAEVRKALLRGGRSGKRYLVPGTSVEYTASAPGEAPAPRTGELGNSYRLAPVSATRVRIGSGVPQAQLEFGTDTVAPRPHLRPAVDRALPLIRAKFPTEFP